MAHSSEFGNSALGRIPTAQVARENRAVLKKSFSSLIPSTLGARGFGGRCSTIFVKLSRRFPAALRRSRSPEKSLKKPV